MNETEVEQLQQQHGHEVVHLALLYGMVHNGLRFVFPETTRTFAQNAARELTQLAAQQSKVSEAEVFVVAEILSTMFTASIIDAQVAHENHKDA